VRNRAYRRDWWLSAQEALELGFVDEILAAPKLKEGRKHAEGSAEPKAKTKTKAKPKTKTNPTRRKPRFQIG
jgi:enoyl-CoA hydratase/carnithine racemase